MKKASEFLNELGAPTDDRIEGALKSIEKNMKDIRHHMSKPAAIRPTKDIAALFTEITGIAKSMARRAG